MIENGGIGLDLSLTSTGMIYIWGGGINDYDGKLTGYPLKKTSTDVEKMLRIDTVVRDIEQFIDRHMRLKPVSIAIEAVPFAAKGMIVSLGELLGAVRIAIYRRFDIFPSVYIVTAARKFIFGKAENKKKVKKMLEVRYGMTFIRDDVMDAWVIGMYGWCKKLGKSIVEVIGHQAGQEFLKI